MRLPVQILFIVFLFGLGEGWASTLYVNVNSAFPYATWGNAAVTIQAAVDAASPGDLILVTNGTYQSGSRAANGDNRVAVNKPITVQSVNGPEVTTIKGFQLPGVTNGEGAIRCVYLTNNAALIGFTLTGGGTRTTGDFQHERSGGGIWCETAFEVLRLLQCRASHAWLRTFLERMV